MYMPIPFEDKEINKVITLLMWLVATIGCSILFFPILWILVVPDVRKRWFSIPKALIWGNKIKRTYKNGDRLTSDESGIIYEQSKCPELILNGENIPEEEFNRQFLQLVGCTFREWIEKPTTQSDGDEEWYEWKDDQFTLGGTAYAAPKLYKN